MFILDIVYATFVPIFFLYFAKLFEKSKNESINTVSRREQGNNDRDVDGNNIKLAVDILPDL